MPLEWRSAVSWADAAFVGRKPMKVRRVLLPFGILAMLGGGACGPPASDAGFTTGKTKSADSAGALKKAPSPPVAQARPSIHRGLYRRLGDDSRFRPCAAPAALEVTGTPLGRAQLAEQFRWNSVWQGRNMFGVFEGMIMTDTVVPKATAADSATRTIRTRFFITAVESLRTWEPRDCNGMRVP